MSKIFLIAAMSENQVIGVNNKLPWHLPDEWKNFRNITDGMPFITGRKSYQAPDALHSTYRDVVLTSKKSILPKTELAENLEEALEILKDETVIFILGGASVFKEAIQLAERIYLTVVHIHLDGDAFFPNIKSDEWDLEDSVYHAADEEHEYAFSMNILNRKK